MQSEVPHDYLTALVLPSAATALGPAVIASPDDLDGLILAAVKASIIAARDAEMTAQAAAATTLAARNALQEAAAVAASASHAIAVAVSAAAWSTEEIATQAATAVEAQAVSRALEVAASAVTALETVASALSNKVDPGHASRAAALVAAAVAADVVTNARSRRDSASMVAAAVVAAADAAASAATAAAAAIDLASGAAAATEGVVAGSSAAMKAASDVAVESSARVADLVAQLRSTAASRRTGDAYRARLVAELEAGLSRDELRLEYQPIYSVPAGDLVAVEALLRWQHPSRGLLPPGKFLDVAEGQPLMDPIGEWVLSTAVAQAAEWQRCFGIRAPHMWVNIAGDRLGRQHLTDVVRRLLTEPGLARGTLGIEVTERQLLRAGDAVADQLATLRDLGVSLAVDDFGMGYASLDYLRRYVFDEIKIDSAFIAGLGHHLTDTAVISSIIALGRTLNLAVVAEGVETQDQYDRLCELGCSLVQGYLLQRPAVPEVITGLLRLAAPEAGHPASQ